MYSQEELNISNKSYINKDFPAIYAELLDVAQKISYKYDPTTSNESDPMILLFKLMAVLGDKLNYNIDKNILERFLPSITQWNSMQERTSSIGYNMHYYQSALGYINIKYNLQTSGIEEGQTISFPAFETKFSNPNNNVNYVLITPITFYNQNLIDGTYIEGQAIQGECKLYTSLTGDQSLVTINDLDDFNRLYFPEAMVAQNGVFIEQNNSFEDWHLVDNLNTQVPGTKCYIFRYDSVRKLPYIQFPDDIASLIEGGLTIRYIITNGENGNTNANSITSLLTNGIANFETESDELTNLENYLVTNFSAFTNGTDVEGIDEAYNNCKKIVGTFDTLVTCRDYANYIYNLSDEQFKELVSNVQVCDRRDDYNYNTKVITYNQYGQQTINQFKKVVGGDADAITAFDLCLYPLQPMNGTDKKAFKNSFTVLADTSLIQNMLEDSKCLSHNYKQLEPNDVYAFKNYYKLNAKITTTYKVNQLNQVSVKNNIIQALINNFNARKVDYGEEIPFDTILKVIENADSRIKFVSLEEPQIDTKILLANGTEINLNGTELEEKTAKINYLAKNVLAGKVPLYDYDNDFKYNFTQKALAPISNVQSLITCLKLSLSTTSQTLLDNEIIQIFQPNYLDGRSWTYGWFYDFISNDSSKVLNEGINKLTVNDYINIYEAKNSETVKYQLTDCLVYVNFAMNQHQADLHPTGDNPVVYHKQFNSGEELLEKTINYVTLDTLSNLYWITNNCALCEKDIYGDYQPVSDVTEDSVLCSYIPWDTNDSYVLLDGEYLYVTDSQYTYLSEYGPGTKLTKVNLGALNNIYLPIVDGKDINEQGLSSLTDKFYGVDLSSNNYIRAIEQSILTLTKDDNISLQSSSLALYEQVDDSYYVNNLYDASNYIINYSINNGESGTIKQIDNENIYIRARLDINCDSEKAQVLTSPDTRQLVYTNIEDTITALTYTNINSKYPINIIGGTNRLIKYYSFIENQYINNELLNYTPHTGASSTIEQYANKYDGYYQLQVKDGKLENNSSISGVTFNIPVKSNKDTLIMIYCNSINEDEIIDKIVNLYIYNAGYSMSYPEYDITDPDNPVEKVITRLHQGINVIRWPASTTQSVLLQFNDNQSTPSNFNGNIVISTPTILNGLYDDAFNPQLKIEGEQGAKLLEYINDYNDIFYFNCNVENSSYIDVDNINDADSLFDYNNVVNKITIPEIDIDYAINNINIAKSSQL